MTGSEPARDDGDAPSRDAGSLDADELVALDAACFPAFERWNHASWADELAANDRVLLARRDPDGALVGAATFQVVFDTADLHRVMVRPDHRGRRQIGRAHV